IVFLDILFFFQAEDGIRDRNVTGVQTCALPICGGKGYFVCKLTEETGHVAAVEVVEGTEDMMLMTIHGVLIRIPVDGISITGRNTQGVRLIRLQDDEEVATVTQVVE